jgi:ABC-type bacteriocin/lantibiotic exporter with double-glycine peptidase domain
MMHHDAGLDALAIVARLYGKSVNPEELRRALAIDGIARAEDLLRGARRTGFKAVLDTLDLRCTRPPLPCLVQLKDGAGFAVLAKIEGARAVIHYRGRAGTVELEALQATLSGLAVLISVRTAPPLTLSRLVNWQ